MEKSKRSLTAVTILLIAGLLLTLAVNLTPTQSARASMLVRYAAPSPVGSGDCSTWADACSLQTALAVALPGDEVWVKAGVHTPTSDPANTSAAFSLKNAVVVYGGFAGTETSLDQRDWQANLTILSGDIDGNDVNTDGNFIAETPADIQGSNSIHVVWNSNVDPTAVLNGFVITAGKYVDVSLGAGMYNVNASPTLVHLTLSGNSGYEGGGMFNHQNSSPTVTLVTFTGNSAVSGGGGIKNYSNSSPLLTNVVFSGNSAYNGGGMFSYTSSPLLRNVLFKGNTATNGGGIYSYEGAPVLFNTTFSGNSAFDAGGAYQNGGSLTIHNSILWGDTATVTPEIKADSGTITVEYSNISGCGGSSAWNSACGVDGGGNIDIDPLYRDFSGGDMRLQDSSPAIDAGNNAAVPEGLIVDLDRSLRLVDIPGVPDTGSGTPPIVDMGAYEAHPDAVAPTVLSILRLDPSPTNAASVDFAVTFSEAVSGVDAGDFALSTSGISGAAITALTSFSDGSPVYVVTVATGAGSGTLRLDIPDTAAITDLQGNLLGGLPFESGEVYTFDKTAPSVLSITRLESSPTSFPSVGFSVTFSEAVAGVAADDFSLAMDGSLSGASVTEVSGSGAAYTVTVNTGSGDGSLRLDVPDSASISDLVGNPLGGLPFTTGEAYTVDKTLPVVQSITRLDPSPTNLASVDFSVLFSEDVTGVEAADFTPFLRGEISGVSVTGVSGSAASYTVSVDTGSGDGAIRLDVPITASINDLAGNALGGKPYESGEEYTVDKTAPTVLSITRLDPNPTNEAFVRFEVTFSEEVSGVDADDFVLTTGSYLTGVHVTGLTGTRTSYIVTVNTGIGGGSLRLDVAATAEITDPAGNLLSPLPYEAGEAYTILFELYFPWVSTMP